MYNWNSEGIFQPMQQEPSSAAAWQAALGLNQTTPGRGQFNPDTYQSAADITSAWYAAGRPQQDMYGRDLDVRGMPITMNGRQMSAPQQTQQVYGQQPGPQFGPVGPQQPMQQPQGMAGYIQNQYQQPAMSQNQGFYGSMFNAMRPPQVDMTYNPNVMRQYQPQMNRPSYGGMSGGKGGMGNTQSGRMK